LSGSIAVTSVGSVSCFLFLFVFLQVLFYLFLYDGIQLVLLCPFEFLFRSSGLKEFLNLWEFVTLFRAVTLCVPFEKGAQEAWRVLAPIIFLIVVFPLPFFSDPPFDLLCPCLCPSRRRTCRTWWSRWSSWSGGVRAPPT